MSLLQSVFGTIALITSFIGLLPQSYKALKTRKTGDISMVMLSNFLICSAAWIIYGIFIHSSFVILSNIVGFACCLLLIFQKRHYDQYAE